MRQQRVSTPRVSLKATKRLWRPEVIRAGGPRQVTAQPDDIYAAIDDVAFGLVTIDLAPWPRLSPEGHLTFGVDLGWLNVDDDRLDPDGNRLVLDEKQAHEIIDARRSELQQTTRSLRIGDVFRLSRSGGEHPKREIAKSLDVEEDVTLPAREAAKISLYSAVAPRLSPEEEERLPEPDVYEPGQRRRDREPPESGHGAFSTLR